ncbi:MAG: hypothetical protein AB7L84_06260 [Acidimicrobiia bacterium]
MEHLPKLVETLDEDLDLDSDVDVEVETAIVVGPDFGVLLGGGGR